MKKGTLVKIKPEWREPDEDPNDLYVVLEDRGDRSLFARVYLPDEKQPAFPGTWCWSDETVYKVGEIEA